MAAFERVVQAGDEAGGASSLSAEVDRARERVTAARERAARAQVEVLLMPDSELIDLESAQCSYEADKRMIRGLIRGQEGAITQLVASLVRDNVCGNVARDVKAVSGPLGELSLRDAAVKTKGWDLSKATAQRQLAAWLRAGPAVEALDLRGCKLGPAGAELLLTAVADGKLPRLRSLRVRVEGGLASPVAQAAVVRVLEHGEAGVARGAAEAAVACVESLPAEVAGRIMALLGDADPGVRDAALDAFGKLQPKAQEAQAAALVAASEAGRGQESAQAAVALSKLTAVPAKLAKRREAQLQKLRKILLRSDDQARVEGNSLVAGAHEFRVMPEAAPEGGYTRHGQQQPFALPAGFRPVSRADADFDVVKEKVMAAYGWSAHRLAVRKGAADGEGFSTFYSKNQPPKYAGTVHSEDSSYIKALADGQYRITESSPGGWSATRLLLRRQV